MKCARIDLNLKLRCSTSRKKLWARYNGFTLLELLIVLAVIGILSGLLLPALARQKVHAQRGKCSSNIRQLLLASQMYAHDDRRGAFSARVAKEDQSLNYLYDYVATLSVFTCPSTGNYIREMKHDIPIKGGLGFVDLSKPAFSRKHAPGSSYQNMGFMGKHPSIRNQIPFNGTQITVPHVRKTMSNVQTYSHKNNAFQLKGTVAGPSRIWLIIDNTAHGTLYYPDSESNHGAGGAHVGFCDGHVDWIHRDDYVLSYELSQDENRTGVLF